MNRIRPQRPIQSIMDPPTTPRSRKRVARPPLLEVDVGSAPINTSNSNPTQSTHSASNTGSVHTDETTLLALRKKYHRTLTSLAKSEHHHNFLVQCKREKRIPKGLQIKITPQAFLSSKTSIKTEFTNIIRQTEENLTATLIRHYQHVNEVLTTEKEEIEEEMTHALATQSPTSKTKHEELLQKTTTNIDRRKTLLHERATKKMNTLKNPRHRSPRPRAPNRPRPTQQRQPSRSTTRPVPPPPTHNQRRYPSYAAATQGFRTGGSGPTDPRTQHIRPALLPDPQQHYTRPSHQNPTQDTQQLILQTLTQLLQTLRQ